MLGYDAQTKYAFEWTRALRWLDRTFKYAVGLQAQKKAISDTTFYGTVQV